MKRRSGSIQGRILITCIALSILAAMLVSLVSYNLISSVIRRKESANTQNKLEALAQTMDQRVESVLSFMDSFVSNSAVNAAMVSAPWRYTNHEAQLISTLFKTAILSNDAIIDSIIVYTDRGKFYAGGNGNVVLVDEVRRRAEALDAPSLPDNWTLRLERQPKRGDSPEYGLSLYYTLRNTSSLESIGMVYAILLPERLIAALSGYSEDRRILLADENLSIIYSQNPEDVGQPLPEPLARRITEPQGHFLYDDGGARQFAVYTTSRVCGWHLVETVPYATLTEDLGENILYIMLIFAGAMALVILLAVSGIGRILRPLRQLTDAMVAVQNDNYDVELPVKSQDEIGRLTQAYNRMRGRIRQLIADIYASEQKKRKTELLVLQTQINPHFLYNTLNSIHWMAAVHGLNNISDMVNSLVAILRYSLNRFSPFTTLKVEVDMLEPYLFIQNARFSNGITFESHIPEAYAGCQIPRLLLQPLVENAISHGIRPKGGRGSIRIECAAQGDTLCVDVIDDGAGLKQEVPEFTGYDKLRALFPTSSADEMSIGLENTAARLRLYFGDEYGLFFLSRAGQGTTVRVTLPITYAPETTERQDAP